MGNGNTISIVVTADTAAAAAQLKALAQQTGSGLNVVKQSVAQVGAEAEKAGAHVAGMSYYFRSGIDSIRFAMAGGGQRAGFYAMDEAIRGVISSGMKLSTLVPVLGVLTAAVGVGYLAWHEWNAGMAAAEKHAKDLADAWKELPKLIQQIADMQQDGLLSPAAASEYADYATGKKKLYVDAGGNVTRSAGQNVTSTPNNFGMSPWQSKPETTFVPNREATFAEGSKYLQDQMSAGGEVTKEQLDALNQAREEVRKFNEEGLQGIEKQKQEVKDRYQEERDQMNQTLTQLRATLSTTSLAHSKQAQDLQAALAASPGQEASELAGLDQKTPTQSRAAGEDLKQAWSAIEDEITAKAQAASKQRDSYYQEEYALRIGLAEQMFATGQLSESQYNDAVKQATDEMTAAQRKLNEELRQEQELRAKIARDELENKLREINGNPFLTDQQKTANSIPLYQRQIAENQTQIADAANTMVTAKDPNEQIHAKEQLVQLTGQQIELQQQLNAAQGSNSWSYQMHDLVTQLQNVPPLAEQVKQAIFQIRDEGINTIASNLTKVIEGTESWHKALQNIARTMETDILQAILKIITQKLVELTVQLAIDAATGGGSLLGLAEGGYTGDGPTDQVAGIVHKGEYVMPAGAVQRLGLRNLQALHQGSPMVSDAMPLLGVDSQTAMAMQGRGGAGGYSPDGRSQNLNFHFYDERPHPRDYLNSPVGETHVVNIARKNREKIGIGT
jgi:hypothetical protein